MVKQIFGKQKEEMLKHNCFYKKFTMGARNSMKRIVFLLFVMALIYSCKGNNLEEIKDTSDCAFLYNYVGKWKIYKYELAKGVGTRTDLEAKKYLYAKVIVKIDGSIYLKNKLLVKRVNTNITNGFIIDSAFEKYRFIKDQGLMNKKAIMIDIDTEELYGAIYFVYPDVIFIGSEGDFFMLEKV